MELLKEKKISFLIALFSFLMLLFGLITKDFLGSPRLVGEYSNNPPLKLLTVNIFNISFGYVNFLLTFIIILGIGIFLLVYKKDNEIKDFIKKPNFIKKILNKSCEFKRKSLIVNNNEDVIKKTDITIIIVRVIVFFALLIAIPSKATDSSTAFFILLAYFQTLTMQPDYKSEIVLKAIFYSLIFLFYFSFVQAQDYDTSSGWAVGFDYWFARYLGKNAVGFSICVIIIIYSLFKRFKNKPKFSFKNPLLWVSLISFITMLYDR